MEIRNVFLEILISDNNSNIMNVSILAKISEAKSIGLTGLNDGVLEAITYVTIKVPENIWFRFKNQFFNMSLHIIIWEDILLEYSYRNWQKWL